MPDRSDHITLIRQTVIGLALIIVAAIGTFGLWYGNNLDSGGEDGEYTVLSKPMLDEGDKITVREFFSYACNHCRNFEPLINSWGKTLAEDVVIEQIPLGTDGAWGVLAHAYHAMDVLNILETGHLRVFIALHDQKINLFSMKALADFLSNKDVSARLFYDTAKGDEVKHRLAEGNRLAARWSVSSVPTLVVAGKYLVSTDAGMHAALNVVDELIEKERSARL